MKLTIFNGSPKKGKNNTEIMINNFIRGFEETKGNSYEIYKLNKLKSIKDAVKLVEKSDYILLAFPLYNYSMPAVVKYFIENLEPLCKKKINKKIGFLVQYGFPEAIHARGLEKYLEKLCARLNFQYSGTIIKGGCNNLSSESGPEFINKKIIEGIYQIGRIFGENSILDKKLIDKYSKPERNNFISKLIMKFMVKLINKHYWQVELIKNNVIDKSFARPYQK